MAITYVPPKNNKAKNIKLDDVDNNFQSNDVEGALKELIENGGSGSGHIHGNKTTLDKITEEKLTSWDNKLDSIPSEYVTESELTEKNYATNSQLGNKVDKVEGKGLSTNDYTTAEKEKLEGLNNYTLPKASASELGGIKVGTGLDVTSDGVLNATGVSVDLTPYQQKTDSTLTTTSKEIVGAINEHDSQIKKITDEVGTETLPTTSQTLKGAIAETFQNVSNGKNLIASAITDKGVDATSNDTWQELANKILSIITQNIQLNSIEKLNYCKFNLISSISNTSYNSILETSKSFDDTSWEEITIPHDWSIYNEFNSSSPSGYEGGYLDGGDAWYRIKLKTAKLEGQKVYIYFDGIYMESDIYINGTKIKSNKWYNPFYVEITDYLDYDNTDILSVFVRSQQPSSRWYSGSGIIRNVYLITANDISVGIDDVCIKYPNLETQKNSDVTTNISLNLKNINLKVSELKIENNIYYNNSKVSSKTDNITLSGTEKEPFTTSLIVNKPNLWDEYVGNCYMLETKIFNKSSQLIYSTNTIFGYRYFKFDKDTGFWLNGKNIKLRGVCMHHDLGCLGSEVNKSAIQRQVRLLKEIGVNSIRTSHNPSSTEFLEVCREEGILVIEEFFDCWTSSKKTYDFARYYDEYAKDVIENTVKRGLNNPAIIMWSIGNEIIRTSGSYSESTAINFVTNMINWIKAIDSTRFVTMGDDTPDNPISQACMQLLDVIGVNYGSNSEYSSIRNILSDKSIYGSETTSALSSRGEYEHNNTTLQCSSFDDDKVSWGEYASTELKKHMSDINYLAGMFVWTGFDYIGEPTPFNKYPCKSSYFGIYDTCGFAKDIAYMYQSRWTNEPMIHILPHWDWESGTKIVWLYSNCYKVELFLNGTSLGSNLQSNIGDKYQFEYSVSYSKGTLVANGYDENNNLIAQDIVYTSQGTATTTKLYSDKSSVNINSDDLVFITCDLVDSNDVIVPNANNKITFTIEGGNIVGTDNGNASCVEKYRSDTKSAFNGKVLCVVKHDGVVGNLVVKVNGIGISEKTITITKNNNTTLNTKQTQIFIDATNPPIYDYDSTIYYTITNSLINVTNNNTATSISQNSTYNGILTANENYVLDSVTITMGGLDITSTSYNNGNINIPSVTGDIVITAVATESTNKPSDYEIYLDASNHGANNDVWEDLSGHNNNVDLYGFNHDGNDGWIDNKLVFNGDTSYGLCAQFKPFETISDFECELIFETNNDSNKERYALGLMKEVEPWYGFKIGTDINGDYDVELNLKYASKIEKTAKWNKNGVKCVKIILLKGELTYYLNGEIKDHYAYENGITVDQPLYLGANIIDGIVTRFNKMKVSKFTFKKL